VRQRAVDGPGFGHFREAKIEDLDPPVHLDFDVGGLQVSVEDALLGHDQLFLDSAALSIFPLSCGAALKKK